jgi:hypothetical protein
MHVPPPDPTAPCHRRIASSRGLLRAVAERAAERDEELARILRASRRPAEAAAARNTAELLRRALR